MEHHDIHSPHNACMYRHGCKSTEAKLAELAAERDELRETLNAVSDALDYLHGLTPQQAAALRKDAERYRWLRHGDNDEKCIEFGRESLGTRDDVWLMRGEKLDAACDAGMQRDAEQEAHTIAVPAVGAA